MRARSIERIAIFGVRGQMGSLFGQKALEAGYKVDGFDLPLDLEHIRSLLPASELVLLCVPMDALDSLLSKISPYLSCQQILMDICSVKVLPLRTMKKYFQGAVIGSHPLFGPVQQQEFRKVALCVDDHKASYLKKGLEFWQKLGFEPFLCTAQEHDQAMAYIQGLNFITTLTYFACKAGEEPIKRFITPSFKRRLDAAQKMLRQDFKLFATMFERNPYSADCIRQFRSFLNLAAAGEIEVLAEKSWWWWKSTYKKGKDKS
ncbi:MAG: prephenate dehydrogenase/arogenate dehydrogenase family protein [Desulfonauticus sp.]|nr:prephenate dehydrogenase/arogenate dehydrogenase family protein [Desulfonauticus sp.]